MKYISIVLVLMAVMGCGLAPPYADEQGAYSPAKVNGDALLFFMNPDEDQNGRVDRLFVFDPQSDQPAQQVWAGDEPPFPRPLALMGKSRVLMDHWTWKTCYQIELATGRRFDLLETEHPLQFVSAERGSIYFTERIAGQETGSYKLKTGEGGKTVVQDYARPQYRLYVFDTDKHAATRLSDGVYERVVFEDDDSIWAITYSADTTGRELCKVDKTGGVKARLPFPDHWVAPLTQIRFSDSGRRLAMSSIHEAHDFHEEQELQVVDLATNRVLIEKSKIKPGTWDSFGEPARHINISWLDESRVHVGALTIVDIESGDMTVHKDWIEALQEEDNPPRADSNAIGFFEVRHGQAYFKGDKAPIADTLDDRGSQVRDLAVDQEGRWVAFVSKDPDGIVFVHGQTKAVKRLRPGWGYDLKWVYPSMSLQEE